MGLFHKTIQDMKTLVKQGKYNEAKKILDQHIDAEHHFASDLSSLMRAAAAFQQQLMNLQGWWSLSNGSKYNKKALPTFEKMVVELEGQLTSIHYLMNKLLKEERVKLE
jgi:hypothetical protein